MTMTIQKVRSDAPSRAQLALALDALDIPIVIASLGEGALLFTNAAFRARFDTSGGDIASVERGFAVAPSERFRACELIDEAGESRGAQVAEFHNMDDQRSYLVRALAIRWDQQQLARLHALVDITPRVETQRFQRTQQEKLLLSSRLIAVGELASTLAHELNQPLGAIINYVQGGIRRLRASANDVEPVIEALRLAQLQAEHAAKVVSRMREFVRAREPRRELVHIADIVREVTTLIEPEAQKHRVRLSLVLADGLPSVQADRVMIEQVVLNLLKNAIEAMTTTPLNAREAVISASLDAEGMVEVAVEDSGCGLGGATHQQLFSPFFTTKPDGMGIGLSICRSIIEYHGGGLFFADKTDGGARFWFTLPAGDP
jgi:C4-dicarboxylate-specific signal transduction histidine kinase